MITNLTLRREIEAAEKLVTGRRMDDEPDDENARRLVHMLGKSIEHLEIVKTDLNAALEKAALSSG